MAMSATKKKGFISEDDAVLLLQRYSPATILTLLQEVAQSAAAKIDWKNLVKRTNTGVSSAREYHMLWRHLAYHETLSQKLENGPEHLEDDSDLEFELEASDNGPDDCSEVVAAVKVLMSHGWGNDSTPTNSLAIDASFSLNHTPDSLQVPGSSQGLDGKQASNTISSSDAFDGNSSLYPPRKKRKLWTHEEDMELIAAVQKCGEGNWANILKGDFKHERTASQLSQRWAIIRKRQANLNSSNSNSTSGSTLSEAQLAARQAVSIALNMPIRGALAAIGGSSETGAPKSSSNIVSEASFHQEMPLIPVVKAPFPPKARNPQKKPVPAPGLRCSIQEVAVAAGARIATPSTAASILKAAQSKNAVHIKQSPISMASSSRNMRFTRTAPRVMPSVSRSINQVGAGKSSASCQVHVPTTASTSPSSGSVSPIVAVVSTSSVAAKSIDKKMENLSDLPEVLTEMEPASLSLKLDGDLATTVDECQAVCSEFLPLKHNESENRTYAIQKADDKKSLVEEVKCLPVYVERSENIVGEQIVPHEHATDDGQLKMVKMDWTCQPKIEEQMGTGSPQDEAVMISCSPASCSEPAGEMDTVINQSDYKT